MTKPSGDDFSEALLLLGARDCFAVTSSSRQFDSHKIGSVRKCSLADGCLVSRKVGHVQGFHFHNCSIPLS